MTLHSITATYPGFQSLPKGIKQMLLVSESVFFENARATRKTTLTAEQRTFAERQRLQNPPDAASFIPRGVEELPLVPAVS